MLKKILVVLLFPFFVNGQTAFISGNDTICDNGNPAEVVVDFTGIAPFSFSYNVNGVTENVDSTMLKKYLIETKISGNYTLVSFSDNNGIGSIDSIDGSAIVTIFPSPTAVIHIDSDTLSVLHPIVTFIDESEGNIVAWDWNFGDNTLNMNTESAIHNYKDSLAVYQASLIVYDNNGCSDTTTHNIWVRDEYWIYIPNSFTPDNDKVNDKLCIEYNGIRENTFFLKIINLQGDLMYQYSDPSLLRCSLDGGWDGTHYKTNEDLPSDTYVYEVYFQDFEGWKHKEYGSITIIR
jgi:gliding motility-associated-like protein